MVNNIRSKSKNSLSPDKNILPYLRNKIKVKSQSKKTNIENVVPTKTSTLNLK